MDKYIKKQKKIFLNDSVAYLATHSVSYILETTSNSSRCICIIIHAYTKHHLYVHTQ